MSGRYGHPLLASLLTVALGTWPVVEALATEQPAQPAEVAVSAFNALNDKHKEHLLGDTIGSRVMGWLTVKF
jgi:hypothetical protein